MKSVRAKATVFVTCLAVGCVSSARGDNDFWTKPSSSPARNDKNVTNWAGTPPAGANVPIGAPPKPNPFQRAASAVGSAASSFSSGVKNVFSRKQTPFESADSSPTNKPPAKKYDANFHVTLAQLQERTNNFEGAQEQYEKALKLDPDHLGALLGYGHLYDRQQKYGEALGWYQKAAKKHPQEAACYNDLGLCYSQLNRLPDAVAALEKAANLQPTKKLYRNNLAAVLVKMNRPDDAYGQLAAVHPPAIARYNVGYLLTQQNQRQLAYQYFRDALHDDPNLAEARDWCNLLAPSVAQRPLDVVPVTPSAVGTPRSIAEVPVATSTAPQRAIPPAVAQAPAVQTPSAPNPQREAQPAPAPESVAEMPTPVNPAPETTAAPTTAAAPSPRTSAAADVAEAPLPASEAPVPGSAGTMDRLAAPAPETIGTPSGGTVAAQPPRPSPRRAQRSGYVPPSRY
ncbi:MAG: tetratricopeptide repeat protein [Planctomycetaceae bacterium]|nr:tetratricopeptide repeat protein [Planctomycetaceae bacterium]